MKYYIYFIAYEQHDAVHISLVFQIVSNNVSVVHWKQINTGCWISGLDSNMYVIFLSTMHWKCIKNCSKTSIWVPNVLFNIITKFESNIPCLFKNTDFFIWKISFACKIWCLIWNIFFRNMTYRSRNEQKHKKEKK